MVSIDNEFSVEQRMNTACAIDNCQHHAFYLNLELRFIWVYIEIEDYRYFKSFSNQELFERPIYVFRRSDLDKLKSRLHEIEVTDYILSLSSFDKCFQINVDIYQSDDKGMALSVFKSSRRYRDTMYSNLYKHHVSYVNNFWAYASKYQCHPRMPLHAFRSHAQTSVLLWEENPPRIWLSDHR